jgi:hypothetical protein
MAQRTSEIIFKDLEELYMNSNAQIVFAVCAVALSKLMGRENWKSYLGQSLKDPEFKKLLPEESNDQYKLNIIG